MCIRDRIILPIEPSPRLLGVSASGRVALVRWEFAGQQPGSLEKFLPSGLDGDPLIAMVELPVGDSAELSLGLLSSDGRFKRLPLTDVLDLSGRATSVVKLKEGVSLCSAVICREHSDLGLVSSMGRLLRLPVNDSVSVESSDNGDGSQTVTMRLNQGINEDDRRFLRLQVSTN